MCDLYLSLEDESESYSSDCSEEVEEGHLDCSCPASYRYQLYLTVCMVTIFGEGSKLQKWQ